MAVTVAAPTAGVLPILGAVVIGTINASGSFEQYVGPSYKSPCRCATTGAITIATGLNAGDAIDGITLVAGDRVLVKNQAAPAQNGIYVAGVTPSRSNDFDAWSEIPGAVVGVTEGSTNADTAWICTSDSGGTLDTTAINFSAFGTSVNLTAPGPIGSVTPSTGEFTTLATTTSLAVGAGGAVIAKIIRITTTLSSSSVSAGAYFDEVIAAAGASDGDVVLSSMSSDLVVGIVLAQSKSTTDNVTLRFFNTDLLSAQNLPGGAINILVLHH